MTDSKKILGILSVCFFAGAIFTYTCKRDKSSSLAELLRRKEALAPASDISVKLYKASAEKVATYTRKIPKRQILPEEAFLISHLPLPAAKKIAKQIRQRPEVKTLRYLNPEPSWNLNVVPKNDLEFHLALRELKAHLLYLITESALVSDVSSLQMFSGVYNSASFFEAFTMSGQRDSAGKMVLTLSGFAPSASELKRTVASTNLFDLFSLEPRLATKLEPEVISNPNLELVIQFLESLVFNSRVPLVVSDFGVISRQNENLIIETLKEVKVQRFEDLDFSAFSLKVAKQKAQWAAHLSQVSQRITTLPSWLSDLSFTLGSNTSLGLSWEMLASGLGVYTGARQLYVLSKMKSDKKRQLRTQDASIEEFREVFKKLTFQGILTSFPYDPILENDFILNSFSEKLYTSAEKKNGIPRLLESTFQAKSPDELFERLFSGAHIQKVIGSVHHVPTVRLAPLVAKRMKEAPYFSKISEVVFKKTGDPAMAITYSSVFTKLATSARIFKKAINPVTHISLALTHFSEGRPQFHKATLENFYPLCLSVAVTESLKSSCLKMISQMEGCQNSAQLAQVNPWLFQKLQAVRPADYAQILQTLKQQPQEFLVVWLAGFHSAFEHDPSIGQKLLIDLTGSQSKAPARAPALAGEDDSLKSLSQRFFSLMAMTAQEIQKNTQAKPDLIDVYVSILKKELEQTRSYLRTQESITQATQRPSSVDRVVLDVLKALDLQAQFVSKFYSKSSSDFTLEHTLAHLAKGYASSYAMP